jgi:hypothetical protein
VNNNNSKVSQLNLGASQVKRNVLLFVDGGTYPPESFSADILQEIQLGCMAENFRSRLKGQKKLLKINVFFTNASAELHQKRSHNNLFVDRKSFQITGGYKKKYKGTEHVEIAKRLKKKRRFYYLKNTTIVTCNKYNPTLNLK